LSAQWQTAPVADATVATEVHQTLDIHGNLSPQVAFDDEFCDCRPELGDFRLRQVLYRRRRRYACRAAYLLRTRITNTVNRRQRNHDMLVQRYVYACYTCHLSVLLSLALFMPRVSANHAHNTIAANDLAVSTHFPY
jgi:hypothetical protein